MREIKSFGHFLTRQSFSFPLCHLFLPLRSPLRLSSQSFLKNRSHHLNESNKAQQTARYQSEKEENNRKEKKKKRKVMKDDLVKFRNLMATNNFIYETENEFTFGYN